MKRPLNEIKCIFLSKSENEALARSIISGFLLPLDPTVDELADIRCAISEAVTNCIVHGYRDTSGMITLGAKAYDDRTVRIIVSDKGCGIEDVAKELGIELNYDTGYQERSIPEGVVMKRFTIINQVCDADVIISVCKLKTHMFAHFSGAVKNTFGVVPGLDKPVFHSRFPDFTDFAEMLVDLNELIRPDFVIMDAIVGMEGNGPMGGSPK